MMPLQDSPMKKEKNTLYHEQYCFILSYVEKVAALKSYKTEQNILIIISKLS